MKVIRLPGILAYATMAMWLLQLFASPLRAADAAPISAYLPEIEQALIDAGAPADARITLAAPDAPILVADGAKPEFFSVSYNAASGRFLIRARGADRGSLLAVTGTAIAPSLLPVLTRDIERGEVIGETDLDWVESVDARVSFFLTDADEIIGMEARRAIRQGAAVRKSDVSAPLLVRKGDQVTMLAESPGIRLTQAGIALANGAEGDLIEIRNVNSEQLIKAVVIARNLARVPARTAGNYAALTEY